MGEFCNLILRGFQELCLVRYILCCPSSPPPVLKHWLRGWLPLLNLTKIPCPWPFHSPDTFWPMTMTIRSKLWCQYWSLTTKDCWQSWSNWLNGMWGLDWDLAIQGHDTNQCIWSPKEPIGKDPWFLPNWFFWYQKKTNQAIFKQFLKNRTLFTWIVIDRVESMGPDVTLTDEVRKIQLGRN